MPRTVATAVTADQLEHYHREGYIILRGAFSRQRVRALTTGLNRLLDQALLGKPEIGWLDRACRLPGRISNLLHPDKFQPEFANWLAGDLAPQIAVLLGDPGRHSLFGMLAGGAGLPYLQDWHHDLGKPGAPDELEYMMRHHGRFVQFNAPLVEGDRYLQIVPGSHLRKSTPQEIQSSQRVPFKLADPHSPTTPAEIAAIAAWDTVDPMPGALVVELEPGDIVYYNANLWHRGWNPTGARRWTMHCAFWKSELPVLEHEAQQHQALLTPGHLARFPRVARQIMQRYIDAHPTGKPKSLMEI